MSSAFAQVLIARVSDAMPLAESVLVEPLATQYKRTIKAMLRKMEDNNPAPIRCTVTTGDLLIHYEIASGVCYLALCDKSFSKKLAFAYLEDLQQAFSEQYGDRVASAERPYAFIAFDNKMTKLRRQYEDSRTSHRALSKLNTELQDVQQIMLKSIDDVLERDSKLDGLTSQVDQLKGQAAKYRKSAQNLKWKALLQKWGPVGGVTLVILIFLYFYYF
eukprot:m.41768 g.41768  ORF g.41768 m.41768 type:complete len:218 (+) comp10607_c0_seq2:380-1033(+)